MKASKSGITTIEGDEGRFSVQYASVPTPDGPFTVVVGSPLDGVRRSISTLQSTLAVGTPFLIILVGALAWQLGATLVGTIFVAATALALLTLVVGDFCVGSFFYWLLVRRQIFRGV